MNSTFIAWSLCSAIYYSIAVFTVLIKCFNVKGLSALILCPVYYMQIIKYSMLHSFIFSIKSSNKPLTKSIETEPKIYRWQKDKIRFFF